MRPTTSSAIAPCGKHEAAETQGKAAAADARLVVRMQEVSALSQRNEAIYKTTRQGGIMAELHELIDPALYDLIIIAKPKPTKQTKLIIAKE